MKKIFSDPLFAFLLLGGALFIVFQQIADDTYVDNSEIIITEGHVDALISGFERTWQRYPNEEEMNGLVESYVREEILYREALALGLDQEDAIIKRRLSQKIEFLSEDLAGLDEPDDQELETYLLENQEEYRTQARYSFKQVYLNSSKRGETAEADVISLLETLQSNDENIQELGDPLMLDQQFDNETERDIERLFGAEFTEVLSETPLGSWQGPLRSGFGIHLVHISERIEGKNPELSEVRDMVIRDWSSMKREETNQAFYDSLRSRYTVKLDIPERNMDPTPPSVTGAFQ